jgi:hypothetical protein
LPILLSWPQSDFRCDAGQFFTVIQLKVNASKFHTLYKVLNLLIFFAKSLALRDPFWLSSNPTRKLGYREQEMKLKVVADALGRVVKAVISGGCCHAD